MNVIDISLTSDSLITSEIELLIQEIGLLFDTSPGEVIGEDAFGSDFERFVWDLSVSNSQISRYVRDMIYNYVYISVKFNIEVSTSIVQGTKGDIILVKLSIMQKETGEYFEGTYKIS